MYENIITCFTSKFHHQQQLKTRGKKTRYSVSEPKNELVRLHISGLCAFILLPGNRLPYVYLSWVCVSFLFFQHTPAHSVSAAYRFSAVSSFNWKLLPFNVSHVSDEYKRAACFLTMECRTRSACYTIQCLCISECDFDDCANECLVARILNARRNRDVIF